MSTQNSPLVCLSGAGLQRDGRWLVRDVNLAVDAGEIVTLIGPNGSGKSTTAKMALGILAPSEGEAERREDLRVGYVPQKLTIDWTLPLSVSRFMRLTHKLSDDDCNEALSRTGIGHLLNAEMRNLSGGEFQRVMLARAIARKPNLLVLDEPVQGVDFLAEESIYNLISDIRRELNCGVLMISHDLHVVMAATDRVLCLNGHVCCQGAPTAVAKSPEYLQLFGNRAGALAIYQHQHDHTHLPDGTVRHADGSLTAHCFPGDGHHHHDHSGATNDAPPEPKPPAPSKRMGGGHA